MDVERRDAERPQPQPRDGVLTVRGNNPRVPGIAFATHPVNWEMDALDALPTIARDELNYCPEEVAALRVRKFIDNRVRQGQPEPMATAAALGKVRDYIVNALTARAGDYQQRYKLPLPHVGAHAHFQPPPRLGPVGRRRRTSAKVLRLTAHLEPREGLAA